MVSAKALEQKNNPPKYSSDEGIQLVGSDPQVLANATKHFPNARFIELNAGCPVHKVVKKNQGSALLKTLPLLRECAESILNATDLPVTVKTRIGWNKKNIKEIAKTLNGIGLNRVVIHARTAQQNYSDNANWNALREAVEAFDYPVTGNGDVNSYETAKHMVEETSVEGVMIGRTAVHNPFVFQAIEQEKDFNPTRAQKYAFFDEYVSLSDASFFDVRAHAMMLCHGFKYATKIREKLVHAKDLESVRSLFKKQ
jgi:tRNA-dihydrouridine synthase B